MTVGEHGAAVTPVKLLINAVNALKKSLKKSSRLTWSLIILPYKEGFGSFY